MSRARLPSRSNSLILLPVPGRNDGTGGRNEDTMKLMYRAEAAATIISSVVVVGVGGTAMASPCEARNTWAAFSGWGDSNQYFLANGGNFEGGATSWRLWNGGTTGWGQSPFGYAGPGSRSLQLPSWAGTLSPAICVFQNEESLRFAYKAPKPGAVLQVWIEVSGPQGYAYTNTYITASSWWWDVSPIIPMPNLRDAHGRQWVTIFMMPVDNSGTWSVDDVMIDPWIAR